MTRYVSISAFASLVEILIGITSSAIGLKNCVITAAIKKYKSIIKKKQKKYNKIVLLGKSKLNSIEVLISNVLTDSVISHNEFVLINNVLKEYNEMKEAIKNLKTQKKKKTESNNQNVARTKNGRIMLLSNSVVCDSKNRNLLKSKKLVDY